MCIEIEQQDEKDLVPTLMAMATIKDLNALKLAAKEFLGNCRFGSEKIIIHHRKLQQLTNSAAIQQLCWNTLLAGSGLKVVQV